MGQLGELGLGVAQPAEDALALGRAEGRKELGKLGRGAPRQGGDALEVAGQGLAWRDRWRGLALCLEAFEEEHRILEQALARGHARRAPGGVQARNFAAREAMLGRGSGQAHTGLAIAAHQGHEVFHRRGGWQLAGA